MKFSIGWHEDCLRNAMRSQIGLLEQIKRLTVDAERYERDLSIYREQIAEAKRLGVDGFDRDKFMKSKAKRVASQQPNAAWDGSLKEDKNA